MPDFQRLPEETRWQLVYYVMSLSTVFQEQQPEPIVMGSDPGHAQASLSRGRDLYTQLGCNACHGNAGRGDGPSAATLADNWGQPIRAADLTQGWGYRAGAKPADIVARIMTGIDGSPMPSYADALSSKEDAWHLAYAVHALQESPQWGRTIEASKAPGPLPATPEDPIWRDARRTDLRLSSTVYRQGKIVPTTVTSVSLQAVYNDEKVLFRLAWNDPSESRGGPPDAAALLLLSDRRLKWRIGSLRSWDATGSPQGWDLCTWSAERDEAREATTGEPSLPEATGTSDRPLESVASYVDGRWTLLFSRPLAPAGGVKLVPLEPRVVGIAIWDGGNQESGRHRANSNWVDLVLR
jgi:DMSO reductase family type II enzyme heme b subunit